MKKLCFQEFLVCAGVLLNVNLHSQESFLALIGGDPSYAAVVTPQGNLFDQLINPQGIAVPVSPSPTNFIASVAMNASALGLIGGSGAIAGFVLPDATFQPLGLSSDENIATVSLNDLGIGIIGGSNNRPPMFRPVALAQFVTQDGTIINIGVTTDDFSHISSVSINLNNKALIGGSTGMGMVLPQTGYLGWAAYPNPAFNSIGIGAAKFVNSVSLNNFDVGLVGGQTNINDPFVVRVDSDNSVTPIPLGITTSGTIASVSINDSGVGLVGGVRDSISFVGYAARIGSDNSVSEIALPSYAQSIYSVSINSFGEGLLGGSNDPNFTKGYAARISSDGAVTILNLPDYVTDIYSVDMSERGIGIIGGDLSYDLIDYTQYAALVAPNGTVNTISNLRTDVGAFINSVAISAAAIDELLSPKSIGTYASFANTLFNLSQTLVAHYTNRYYSDYPRTYGREDNVSFDEEIGLLVSAGDIALTSQPIACCDALTGLSLWFAPLGALAYQKSEKEIPSYSNQIAGAVVGLEHCWETEELNYIVCGGGLAYAMNYIHVSEHLGHAKINNEVAVVYGSYMQPLFFVRGALWGGLYQTNQERHSAFGFTSKAKPKGWVLNPHLELSVPFYPQNSCWFLLEPFAMFDWANQWQGHYHEHGSSGFNLSVKSLYSSLLRSEAGLRVYEILNYQWGKLLLEEKLSYVNKAPFHTNATSTFFVGAASTFGVEVFNQSVQNLFAAQFSANFIPCKNAYPYGTLNFQAEVGSGSQIYSLFAEIGKTF